MLELRHITKRFGRVLANDDVTLTVAPGTIHAVVGENGAGKSTAMRIAYGFYAADAGEIVIDGKPRQLSGPQDAIALGVGMVHQHFMLVETLTVAENIVLGAEPGPAAALNVRQASQTIRQLSSEFTVAVDPDQFIEDLSVGQQQRVELLKALYRDARLLILDEPTAVLTPQEVADFFAALRRMRSQGKTIVIVTHKLAEVLEISDEVTVMRDGRVVGRVPTAQTSTTELARMMVGREVLLRVDKPPATPGDARLAVRNLSVSAGQGSRALRDVSFSVRAGEIVGIAGVEGNGQTELIEAIAGLIPRAQISGDVELDGQSIAAFNARQRRARGIAHVPEDRHRRGLLLDFSVAENAVLGAHRERPLASGVGQTFLDRRAVRSRAETIVATCDVRPTNVDLPARALSGGNQQKLIVGRESGVGRDVVPRLLLVAQPTRGVDIGAIEFIHHSLVQLRDEGCAILLVSSELDEVMALSDRLIVMQNGRIAGEVDPLATTVEHVGLLMTQGR
jgi:general nucleoside transport system ATP-binding protein